MRHAVRGYTAFLQRVRAGGVVVGKVADAENPSDFLTKWVPKAKVVQASLQFATNSRNAVRR